MKKRKDHVYNKPRAIPKLDSVLFSLASGAEFRKLTIIMRVIKAWKEAVGEKLSKITEVIKYENNILFIRVKSSAWRNEFFHIENEIKTKLQERLGNIKISKIMFF
jgi:predicted nucleic acid-binding Zn ribbon protein